jgi:ketosteroid isomerase-like protein
MTILAAKRATGAAPRDRAPDKEISMHEWSSLRVRRPHAAREARRALPPWLALVVVPLAFAVPALAAAAPPPASTAPATSAAHDAAAANALQEIAAFNQRFTDTTLHMDMPGLKALWADDGVSLLPGPAPIVGKPALSRFLDDVVAQMPGYKVTRHENDFHDIRISGDWASEWATTHQIVQPPGDKPAIEIWGKVLLVLHREPDGWKIEREMWTHTDPPAKAK